MGEKSINDLLTVIHRLRDLDAGCPWVKRQDFRSIAHYTLEEAYEVADAIEEGNLDDLKEELGDLLFHIVFYARVAEEREAFNFSDVTQSAVEKLIRRNPHIFSQDASADASIETVIENWESIKQQEREDKAKQREKTASVLDNLPRSLPALPRAEKIQKRAATLGFDWPDYQGARAKITEELAELDEAVSAGADKEKVTHELGDVLFSCVNLARHLAIPPEAALRASNARFIKRFQAVEDLSRQQNKDLRHMTLDELDALWEQAKQQTS